MEDSPKANNKYRAKRVAPPPEKPSPYVERALRWKFGIECMNSIGADELEQCAELELMLLESDIDER